MKRSFVTLLKLSGVLETSRLLHRRKLVIVTYHGVLSSRAETDGFTSRNFVDRERFRGQMEYLAARHAVLPLAEAVTRLRDGSLPDHSACVTFDDGFRNNLSVAGPILREFRVPCTIFLTTGHIGTKQSLLWTEEVALRVARAPTARISIPGGGTLATTGAPARAVAARELVRRLKALPGPERQVWLQRLRAELEITDVDFENARERYEFLSWEEVAEAAPAWVTWGAHTVSHPILSTLSEDDARREIEASRRDVERGSGRTCDLFAYPNGMARDFGPRERRLVESAGYRAAVSQIPGANGPNADHFALRRINIGLGHGDDIFQAQLSGLWPLLRRLGGRVRS